MKKFALILIAIFALAFVGCEDKDDPPNTDPVHIGTVGGIPVYRVYDIAPANGTATLASVNTIWNNMPSPTNRGIFTEKVNLIMVVSGSGINLAGTTLNIGCNATHATIDDYIFDHIIY